MSKVSSVLTKEEKNVLEKQVADTLWKAVSDGKIQVTDVQPIAREILPSFLTLTTRKQYTDFLERIQKKWSFFASLSVHEKYDSSEAQTKEKEVIDKLSQYIKTLSN